MLTPLVTFIFPMLFYCFVRALDIRLHQKCKPVGTDFCSNLYNETLIERSIDDAILDLNQYIELASTGCAQNTRLFLCGTFLPMCTMLDKPLRPCRSLCEEVKGGCAKVLMQYANLKWPLQLRCEQFHEYSSQNLCIGKNENQKREEVIYSRIIPNRRRKVKERETVQLQCGSLQKISFRKILHEKPSCARSKSQDYLRKLCNNERICEFKLGVVTKHPGQPKGCIPGRVGQSTIKYQCIKDGHAKNMVLKYGEDANLYCKNAARHISILKVQFQDETCISPKVFCSVSQACTGKKKCALWANYYYLQSPCQGKKVKLVVDYECVKSNPKDIRIATGLLGNGIEIRCPHRIRIIRAEYWTPGITQFCQLKQIHCAVNITCDKKKYCRLDEQNMEAVLCTEAISYLRVRYTCR